MSNTNEEKRQNASRLNAESLVKDLRSSIMKRADALRERAQKAKTQGKETKANSERHAQVINRWNKLLEEHSPLMNAHADLSEQLAVEQRQAEADYMRSRLPKLERATDAIRVRLEKISEDTVSSIQNALQKVSLRQGVLMDTVDALDRGVDGIESEDDSLNDALAALKDLKISGAENIASSSTSDDSKAKLSSGLPRRLPTWFSSSANSSERD